MVICGGVRSGRDTKGGPEAPAAGGVNVGRELVPAEHPLRLSPAAPAADAPASLNSRLRVRFSVIEPSLQIGFSSRSPRVRVIHSQRDGGRAVSLAAPR